MSDEEPDRPPQRGLTVVHKAAPEVAGEFVARLRAEGIEAHAVDQPGFLVLLLSFGTYRIRIGVPDDQAERTRATIAEWDRASAPVVREMTRQVRRQVLLASIPALVGVVGAFRIASGFDLVPWLACAVPALFLLSFLALSALERARSG